LCTSSLRYPYYSLRVDYSGLIEGSKKVMKIMRERANKAMDYGNYISMKHEHLYSKSLLEVIKYGSVALRSINVANFS